eukprot:1751815-Rhodomonas_salina.8
MMEIHTEKINVGSVQSSLILIQVVFIHHVTTLRDQRQAPTISEQLVPGMRFFVFDFAVDDTHFKCRCLRSYQTRGIPWRESPGSCSAPRSGTAKSIPDSKEQRRPIGRRYEKESRLYS